MGLKIERCLHPFFAQKDMVVGEGESQHKV